MKTILIFVDWFEPGYKGGGPIRSIAGFIHNLNNFTINVVTNINYNTMKHIIILYLMNGFFMMIM